MVRQKVSFSPRVPTPAIKTSPYSTKLDRFTLRLEIYFPMQNVYLLTQMIFCYIKYCVSVCKFLKDIFGGQTGDKISHAKRKKNNKTTSEKSR